MLSALALTLLDRLTDSLSTSGSQLLTPARAIAFWTAIAMPFSYLPLFALEVVEMTPATFLGLLAINITALILGHRHRR